VRCFTWNTYRKTKAGSLVADGSSSRTFGEVPFIHGRPMRKSAAETSATRVKSLTLETLTGAPK